MPGGLYPMQAATSYYKLKAAFNNKAYGDDGRHTLVDLLYLTGLYDAAQF